MTTITGQCHCGNINYTLSWPDDTPLAGRACSCSFCVMHGGVWTSNPAAALTVNYRDRDADLNYTFGHRTAEFHICAHCGIATFATWANEDAGQVGVVNVNTFESVDPLTLPRTTTDFASEDIDVRLARRARNWMPVTIVGDVAPGTT